MHALAGQVGQQVQQPPELLLHHHVALAVAEVLNAAHLVGREDVLDAQPLGPVRRVDGQCAQGLRVLDAPFHFSQQHGPAFRGGQAAHVIAHRAALGVDEYRVRQTGGEAGLADALGAVQHHPLRPADDSAGDLH